MKRALDRWLLAHGIVPEQRVAVQAVSRFLKEHDYGASPFGAQVLKTSTVGEQTFYVVKLLFPRGDAASLLLAFNAEGKITGINLMSMAGD